MKNITSLLALIFLSFTLSAQNDTLFYEDFNTSNWQLSSLSNNLAVQFRQDTIIHKGLFGGSATDTVGNRTTSSLLTPEISVKDSLGNFYPNIRFSFEQICYIDWTDQALVEYKLGDSAWNKFPKLVTINNVPNLAVYLGQSQYIGPLDTSYNVLNSPYHYFNKLSGANNIWPILDTFFLFNPQNSQIRWVKETFDVSRLINWEITENNFPINSIDSIQIRLSLYDHPAGPSGRSGSHQWWIDDLTIYKGLAVGLEESVSPKFKLFPNPAKDLIRLQGIDSPSLYTYRIYSIQGQLEQEGRLDREQIDISKLESGVYMLLLQNGKESFSQKFIKK